MDEYEYLINWQISSSGGKTTTGTFTAACLPMTSQNFSEVEKNLGELFLKKLKLDPNQHKFKILAFSKFD